MQRFLLSILIGFNMLEFIQKFQPHLPLQKLGNPTNHVFNAAIRANLTNHFLNDAIRGKALLHYHLLYAVVKVNITNHFYNNVVTRKALLPSLECCCRSEEAESTLCQPSPHGRCDPKGDASSFVDHLPSEIFE